MYSFTTHNPIVTAILATFTTMLIATMMYLFFEPTSMFAASDSDAFTISQEVGAEISFSTSSGDVTMAGTAIGGVAGGARLGSTTVAVTTNDSSGYTLAIQFESANGMEHAGSANYISYYATTTPDFDMVLGGVATTGFAYSVSSTNQVSAFDNDGGSCGAGSNKSIGNCYQIQATPTSDFTIVDSNAAAVAEETIIGFQVIAAGNSGLTNGFYYSTTTLTATTKS